MDLPEARLAASPLPMSPADKQHRRSKEAPATRSDPWLSSHGQIYPISNGSKRRSDRSTTSSAYTAPEPLSEHHAESSIGADIVPPSPPGGPLDRHHDRHSLHSHDSSPEHKGLLIRKSGPLDHIRSTPPPGPAAHTSENPLVNVPPPPPGFAHARRRRLSSDSEQSSLDVTSRNLPMGRSDSPRGPPPRSFFRPPATTGIKIPPPPPPSPPRRSQPGRRTKKPAKSHRKRRLERTSGSDSGRSRGSSTYSHSKGQYAQSLSVSTESERVGVDPISARNAREFPPRFPAATTRTMEPSKFAAIHNITSWFHDHGKETAQRFPRDGDLVSEESSPPPPHGLGNARDGAVKRKYGADTDISDSDSSEDSIVDTIEHLWQTLKDKRAKVAEIKSVMSDQRRNLRELRRRRDDADNSLQAVLRPMLVNPRALMHLSPHTLRDRLAEVQKMWNDYNLHESMYEGQELVLDEEEEALTYAEIRFFSVLATGRGGAEPVPRPRDQPLTPTYPSDVPLELRGISPEGPKEELHPLYVKLTSTVGDLQNAQEQHAELQADREALEEDIAVKKSIDRAIPLDALTSLEECQYEEKRLGQRVESLRIQTGRLKQLCEKEGVMRKHMSVGMQYFLDPTIKYEEDIDLEEESPNSHPLRHDQFPELLTQPDHILAHPLPLTTEEAVKRAEQLPNDDPSKRDSIRSARKEHTIETLLMQASSRESKAHFVNRWLLQALRLSSLQVSCLYDTFVTGSGLLIRNTALWQNDVLHYWFRDDTMARSFEESDVESEVAKARRGSADDQYVPTPPMSRAMSFPSATISSMSRATDESSARTIDGSFFRTGLGPAPSQTSRRGHSTWSTAVFPSIVSRA
ncbi:hypothetical protein LIA77_05750 [Sarocladium implicatum]|nr:hypothetical protein LIA77_05750 [Sarocladium implicatum]